MQNTVALLIEGMHCEACVRRVRNAIQSVSGVQEARAEVGSATVKFDPDVATSEQIASAVNAIGFSARVTP